MFFMNSLLFILASLDLLSVWSIFVLVLYLNTLVFILFLLHGFELLFISVAQKNIISKKYFSAFIFLNYFYFLLFRQKVMHFQIQVNHFSSSQFLLLKQYSHRLNESLNHWFYQRFVFSNRSVILNQHFHLSYSQHYHLENLKHFYNNRLKRYYFNNMQLAALKLILFQSKYLKTHYKIHSLSLVKNILF